MSDTIEKALKALTEFESQLDSAKSGASEAKKQMLKKAGEWAEKAKSEAISVAQGASAQAVSETRRAAEVEADSIRREGRLALKNFEESMSKRMPEAADLVTRALLGESG